LIKNDVETLSKIEMAFLKSPSSMWASPTTVSIFQMPGK
jgi:hypothetical protein